MDDKLKEISIQWDLIASERYTTLAKHEDLTYEKILKPIYIEYTSRLDPKSILDVGCGLGFLTKELSTLTKNITGLDISQTSIELAEKYNSMKNITYLNTSIEDYDSNEKFDLIISNMVLMDMPNIEDALVKIRSLLNSSSSFVFTITHPSFWPIYWDYAKRDGFIYNNHKEIITDFKTRNKTYKDFKTSHFHRPLSYYLNLATKLGYSFQNMHELFDDKQNLWYPRFLLIELKK